MKILSFSAIEILPAFLDKSKTQTIRPAWYKIEKLPLMNGGKIEKVLPYPLEKQKGKLSAEKSARFKVGDKIQLMWKARGTPKDAKFCSECGGLFSIKDGHMRCITENHKGFFPKLLGIATITDVFQIEMGKNEEGRVALRNSKYGSEALALVDGFKNREDMFAYFDKHYDLKSAKKFWVYRWRWE